MKTILCSLAVVFVAQCVPSARAVSVYALTDENPSRLLVVDGAVPQNILSVQPISGLDPGNAIVGIDVRPANGQLYAITDGNGIYTINPATGVATKVATLTASGADPFTSLNGSNFGVDFNPVVDRLRVVSNAEQNLRINVDTGSVNTDGTLAYDAGDVYAGANPNVGDVAYLPAVAGVTALYGIDDSTFQIVLQTPANNGTLFSAADFGVVNATHVGFDIASDGTAYAGGKHAVPGTPVEYVLVTVDPLTGLGDSHGPIGDGTIPIRDIAVAPTIAFSAEKYAISEGGGIAVITVKREGFLNTTVSVQYSTFSGTASAASDYATAAGTLTFGPGEDTKTFQVPVVDDIFPEEDEFVGLYLTGVTGPGTLGSPSVAELRINANDRPDLVGPLVEFIGLTGPSRGISGAVVHFNEDLDPTTATNVNNYRLTAVPKRGRNQVLTFESAVYDSVGRKVTLTLTPFMQTNFKRMALRINGSRATRTRPEGVKDLAGNLLDGNRNRRPGGDLVQMFKVFSGTTLKFTDRDGDRVTLELTGLGPNSQLDGVLPVGGPASQTTQFWILDPIALSTSLAGTVRPSLKSNGIVVIAEIIGLDKKEFTPISTNPAFQVNRLTFSSNATGLR